MFSFWFIYQGVKSVPLCKILSVLYNSPNEVLQIAASINASDFRSEPFEPNVAYSAALSFPVIS